MTCKGMVGDNGLNAARQFQQFGAVVLPMHASHFDMHAGLVQQANVTQHRRRRVPATGQVSLIR